MFLFIINIIKIICMTPIKNIIYQKSKYLNEFIALLLCNIAKISNILRELSLTFHKVIHLL